MKAKKDDLVVNLTFGYKGIVLETFKSWDDLKSKSYFETLDPDDEALKSSALELLINGDPRDNWLKMQSIPFTAEQLQEEWYHVKCFDGGSIWCCESTIQIINFILN